MSPTTHWANKAEKEDLEIGSSAMYTIELGQNLDMTYQSEGIESPELSGKISVELYRAIWCTETPFSLHVLPLIHPPTIYLLTLCPIVWPFLLIVIVCPRECLGLSGSIPCRTEKSGIKYPSIYIRWWWFTLLVVHQPRYYASFYTRLGTQRATITHQPTQLLSSSIYLWCCVFYRVHAEEEESLCQSFIW